MYSLGVTLFDMFSFLALKVLEFLRNVSELLASSLQFGKEVYKLFIFYLSLFLLFL